VLDLVLLAFLALGLWRGLQTGALLQIVGTLGWVVAFVIGTALMAPVGDAAAASLGVSARVAPLLGFLVTFGAVVVGLTVAAHAVRKGLKAVKLGAFDTLAGAALGLLRAAFGLSVFLRATGVSVFPGGEPLLISSETREGSVLYGPVEAVAPAVWNMARAVFPGVQDRLGDLFNSFDEAETRGQ
jgi:membrane protein required for colicin V production